MDNEYEFYFPGVYDKVDIIILEEFQAKLDQINNKGDINIAELVSGKLAGTPGVMAPIKKVTLPSMMIVAKRYLGNNPLFTDKEYAKKTKYGGLITFPFVAEPNYMTSMPAGIGDYIVITGHNDTRNYYRPVYEDDTLYPVIDEQHFEDITPAAGSQYRTFAMSGTGKLYNQKGELVSEGANVVKESFRRHKDPARRNAGGTRTWERPDWWHQRKPHIYTDEDWKYIIGLWKKENLRGAKVLYWEDVKIGDEPTPTVTGPVLAESETEIIFSIPQWATDTRANVLNPKTFANMVKNKQGIYVLPEYLVKKPKSLVGSLPGMMNSPPELANRDGRSLIQNSLATKWAVGMLCNWMGDAGWLQKIGWNIMSSPPGYDESVIPHHKKKPALFEKFPYLEKVPYMKDKRADCHGMEGDISINKAYVFNKYAKDGEFFVDLAWWCETMDKYLIGEGFATIKLPKKN